MGLLIKTYKHSYSALHYLRRKALEYEGNSYDLDVLYTLENPQTKFSEFILHSDCEGLYISKSSKQYDKIKKRTEKRYGTLVCYFGDLDKLKQEVQELNSYMQTNLELGMLKAWNNFYNDVINSRKFLYFR